MIQDPEDTLDALSKWLDVARTTNVRQILDMVDVSGGFKQPPRYSLGQEHLVEIVSKTGELVDELGLTLPVVPFRYIDDPTAGEDCGLQNVDSHQPGDLLECNEPMLVVWSLCNGKRSVKEIVEVIREQIPDGPLWINSAIASLVKQKLVSVHVAQ